jgi:hypothetical protein
MINESVRIYRTLEVRDEDYKRADALEKHIKANPAVQEENDAERGVQV